MSLISICIPAFNEESCIETTVTCVEETMKAIKEYDYEIIIADNDSKDKTREILRKICTRNPKVKAIFNSRNFGPERSGRNAMRNASGDAVVVITADMQDPPEMILEFVKYWEKGEKIVLGQKVSSELGVINRGLRNLYYRIVDAFSDVPQYHQVTGFGIYDRAVVNQLNNIVSTETALRHQLAELGYKARLVPYTQNKRLGGKSSYNLFSSLDYGIMSLCTTSRKPLRLMTLVGVILSFLCLCVGMYYLVNKLINWYTFDAGFAPIILGVFFLGSVQIVFLGLIGEYIGIISEKLRLSQLPLVTEDERINF